MVNTNQYLKRNKNMRTSAPRVPLVMLMTLVISLSGCGEFAYKRGASAADLTQAKRICEQQSDNPAAVKNCLEAQGWSIQPLDDLDPFATASYTSDNRGNPQTAQPLSAKNTAQTQNATEASTESIAKSVEEKPANPMDIFIISSWWKMGGGPAELDKAMLACEEKLGVAHKPNPITHETTRGFGLCMRDLGWRGLKAQQSQNR